MSPASSSAVLVFPDILLSIRDTDAGFQALAGSAQLGVLPEVFFRRLKIPKAQSLLVVVEGVAPVSWGEADLDCGLGLRTYGIGDVVDVGGS